MHVSNDIVSTHNFSHFLDLSFNHNIFAGPFGYHVIKQFQAGGEIIQPKAS